ncbi:hypothetical protein R1flu_023547 [Riccia fluitans]|uniref:Uncharacterized protein n=1 Tax=Riccia fluitans TaxID=41844 RepID=A0ABD1XSC4_9MARC
MAGDISTLWRAYHRHDLKYFIPVKSCKREDLCCGCIICHRKRIGSTWESVFSLISEDDFWTHFWSDDRRTLEAILFARKEENNKVTKEIRSNLLLLRDIYSFRSLMESTAKKFELGRCLTYHPSTYPQYFLWDLARDRIVHTHTDPRKVLNEAAGWKMDPFATGCEAIIASYTYVDRRTKKRTTFRFAWPDLMDTPVLYFLRLVSFLIQSQGMGKKSLRLREFVPRALFEIARE